MKRLDQSNQRYLDDINGQALEAESLPGPHKVSRTGRVIDAY